MLVASSIYSFAVSIAAYAIGAPLVGLLNDRLGAAQNPAGMRYALLISPLACALRAVLLWRGSKKLRALDIKI